MHISNETPLEILILGGGVAGQSFPIAVVFTMLMQIARPHGCHGFGQVLT